MASKAELIDLINQLPEEKVSDAFQLLHNLMNFSVYHPTATAVLPTPPPLEVHTDVAATEAATPEETVSNTETEDLPVHSSSVVSSPVSPSVVTSEDVDLLFDLLKVLSTSVNNSLYDLRVHMERQDEKILAKRLDFSRKRVVEVWTAYKIQQQKKLANQSTPPSE